MGIGFRRQPNCGTDRFKTNPSGYYQFRSFRHNEDDIGGTHILVEEMELDIENKVKDCTACFASGKNPKYQLPKKHYGKLEKLTEPGQEIQIDFTGKLHNKNIHGEVQILKAKHRFSKWPTVKICK